MKRLKTLCVVVAVGILPFTMGQSCGGGMGGVMEELSGVAGGSNWYWTAGGYGGYGSYGGYDTIAFDMPAYAPYSDYYDPGMWTDYSGYDSSYDDANADYYWAWGP